jgi:hypothetical protein
MFSLINFILVVVGLCLFEAISSVDNAVINAQVLGTMAPKYRRWFLVWGIIIAVFVVRGFLPLVIIWLSQPSLGLVGAFTFTFSNSPELREIVEHSKPILLAGGGVFLIFLFIHWLFDEPKEYCFFLERFIHRHSLWFYSFVSVILVAIVWKAMEINPYIALSAVIGSSAFFITSGFKKNAELKEKELVGGHMSDISKILYLELIDATFSIDGVLGAFAFTLSVPLILLGNGLGAFIVRYITVKGTETVKKYRYLKNGAMYSIGVLGSVMLFESFGKEIPEWVSPVTTIFIIFFFFYLSYKEIKKLEKGASCPVEKF